jgi:hypothetical protein
VAISSRRRWPRLGGGIARVRAERPPCAPSAQTRAATGTVGSDSVHVEDESHRRALVQTALDQLDTPLAVAEGALDSCQRDGIGDNGSCRGLATLKQFAGIRRSAAGCVDHISAS